MSHHFEFANLLAKLIPMEKKIEAEYKQGHKTPLMLIWFVQSLEQFKRLFKLSEVFSQMNKP